MTRKLLILMPLMAFYPALAQGGPSPPLTPWTVQAYVDSSPAGPQRTASSATAVRKEANAACGDIGSVLGPDALATCVAGVKAYSFSTLPNNGARRADYPVLVSGFIPGGLNSYVSITVVRK